MSSIQWRDSAKSFIKFCSADEFLAANDIEEAIRKTYEDYITKTNPTTLEKNAKGFYKCVWSAPDKINKFQYTATYSDQYGFGIMRTPLKEDTQEKNTRLERIEKLLVALCNFHKIDVSKI